MPTSREVIQEETAGRRPVKDGEAVRRALDAIRDRIVSGDLSPGVQLRQEELAHLLGTSRPPIREALSALTDQGLLEHRIHSGYFVRRRSRSELQQIYMMLETLETWVMDSIEPPTPTLLGDLRSLNDEIARYVDAENWSPMIDLNRRFHFLIFGLSPLKVILGELERLWTIAAPYIAGKYTSRQLRQRTVDEHARIIDALEDADLVLVAHRLAQHRSQRGAD